MIIIIMMVYDYRPRKQRVLQADQQQLAQPSPRSEGGLQHQWHDRKFVSALSSSIYDWPETHTTIQHITRANTTPDTCEKE